MITKVPTKYGAHPKVPESAPCESCGSTEAAKKVDVISKPKPPTPRSVSATLRSAGFSAYRDGRDEGYRVEWLPLVPGPSEVRVGFESVTWEICDLAMETMTVVLQRKGWSVRLVQTGGGCLIVKAA